MKFRGLLLVGAVALLTLAIPAQARHVQRDARSVVSLTRADLTAALSPALVRMGSGARPDRANANSNPATFTDPTGDAGTTADVTSVVASNDASGTYTFRVNVVHLTLPSDVVIFVGIDSDQNPATGLGGADFLILCDESNGSVGMFRWDGSNLVPTPSSSLTAADNDTGITLGVNRSEIGNSGQFNFFVLSVQGPSATAGHVDSAPDQGSWNYALTAPAPLTLTVASFAAPKSVKAGKSLVVAMVAQRSDTGEAVGEDGQVKCSATLASKRLGLLNSGFVTASGLTGAACAWKVPRTARGKTIRGSITVSVSGASVTHRFALKVK